MIFKSSANKEAREKQSGRSKNISAWSLQRCICNTGFDCSALQVILSGFYDSIGLYQKATRREQEIAKEWLAILHMTPFTHTSFRKLEYGQQRLLLVARAIVKQPTLLILDEPYQGLDYLGRRLIKNALELIARENLSQLLYVSHYQEDSLDSIHNYLEFTPDKNGQGYKTVIS